MKWYKKLKEKRISRHYKIGHALFGDIWDNNKSRDALLLLLWFIFMCFVFALVKTENKENNNIPVSALNYPIIDTYFNKLNNNNYKYNISINENNSSIFITYNGEVANNVDIGIRSINNDILNYKIMDNKIYDTVNNTEITDLYKDYLYYFFKTANIFNYIKDINPSITYDDNNKIYLYNGTYQDLPISFVIKTDLEKITYLEYNYNNYKYILNYNN